MTRIRKRYVHCVKCGQWRWNKGRGLCSTCQERERMAGRLSDWADDKPDTQSKVLPHYLAGLTAAQIAPLLGITRNAAWCAIRALREKGIGPDVGAHDDSMWTRLAVPAPPGEVACKGRPDLFVDWLQATPFGLIMRDGYPDTWAQQQVGEALAVCARCPVRDWCVEATQPARSKVTIIAGGALWHDGRAVWTVADQEALEAAQDEPVAS